MRKTYWIGGAALLLVAAATAWAWLSPAWTLNAMAAAARDNDADRLSAYIDYRALRRDLKADLRARLESDARKRRMPGGEFGVALGRALIEPLTESIVSPRGMKAAFAVLGRDKGGSGEGERRDPVIERDGLGRFVARDAAGDGPAFVFERRGLGWKLVGIDLPPEAGR